MRRNYRRGDHVEIRWRDAAHIDIGWASAADYLAHFRRAGRERTTGYVLRATRRAIVVAGTKSDAGTYNQAFMVPMAIARVRKLK